MSSRVFQSLPNVLIVEFGKLSPQLVAVLVSGERFKNTAYRKPHATDAWLTIQNGWVACDSIKSLHFSAFR
jgi:hypothetical protein